MQDRMEESRQREIEMEERKRLSEREREIAQVRKQISEREREFENYREKLRNEQLAREKKLFKEIEAREALFAEREKKLLERQSEFEHQLMRRQAEVESLRMHLQDEVAHREAKLQQTLLELQQEKERYNEESRKRIERTSTGYVSEALESLAEKEKQFHRISKIWSTIGASALLSGLCFFAYITVTSAVTLTLPITWELIAFSVVKGLIAVSLLAALARYAYLFSSSYMREALKNADRRHAINFGKFYLESYGAAAEWTQVKEAFEHWNITGSNAFSRPEDVQFDVAAIEKAATLLERVGKSLPGKRGDGT